MNEWTTMVAKAEPEIMRTALDAIADHHRRLAEEGGRTIAAPRLGEVNAAYHRAAAATAAYVPPITLCRRCGNSGWSMGLKTAGGYWIDPLHPKRVGETPYHSLIACRCEHGRIATVNDRLPRGAPQSIRDALSRYCIMPMGYIPDDDVPDMTYLRELRGICSEADHADA